MPTATDELSMVFHALADPTRRSMLERLSRGDATVGELGAPFSMSAPAVSQHLRVLEKAKLIERRARAQWRVCSLSHEPLDEAAAWVERNRQAWQTRFDQLDAVLAEADPEQTAPGR
ncbi:metalloregulator ArsR/SmtB family transcription factor [Microbacterium sp. TPD7012]|uniref:ArsR/SmtB family transcription factor n=1 Tax=Microbacterium sp. TPD7012 TaxID=2171975 RepID=UPI000D5203A7|nr:metalloregulator ArsR/SmtB family transcription factor [Microbacterium sp. TPD7012]PVE95754.1 transcriptional regulator [Microbacterium sp. TPD7012]